MTMLPEHDKLLIEVSYPRRMGPPLERLVTTVLAREEGAWQRFWQALEPKLYALLRRPGFLGRISESEDHCRSIVVEVLAALRAGDFARLERYAEARRDSPSLPFLAWLAVVAKRIAIDYMRRQGDYVDLRRAPEGVAKGAWVNLVTLPSDSALGGARPPVTQQALARDILAFAGENLEPEQSRALDRWAQGASFEEIAAAMSLPGAKDAERLVRAAIERLRRHFRTGGSR